MEEQTNPEEQINPEEEQVTKSFAELGVCAELCQACERLNFKTPTPIQESSLPYSLKRKDLIALAETGSGKTLAFALPILQALLDNPTYYFGLIIAPTRFQSFIQNEIIFRELSIQISEQIEAVGAGVQLKTIVLVGGLDPTAQVIAIAKKPHIIIGTPGRLLYHLQNTKGFSLKNLQFLVFDEADKLLNMDFEREINQILEIIPQNRTTFLFSATMTNKVNKLQRASLKNPSKIEVSGKYQTVSTLVQNYIFIPAKEKDVYLVYLLTQFAGQQIIIFCSTVATTQRLYLILKNLGLQSISFHGQMSQVKRLASLNKFKAKQKNILICTEVGSRGLDIPLVDLVINFDVPQHSKDYIHRVGRTARAGKGGRAITIVTQYDVENLQKIEHCIGRKLDVYKVEENDAMIFQQTVSEAQKIVNREVKLMVDRKKDKYFDDQDEEEHGNDKRKSNNNNNNKNQKTKKIQKFNKKKQFRKK